MPGLTMSRSHAAGLLGAWGLVVGCGMLLLGAYAARSGDPGAPSVRWPAGTAVGLDGRRPTLMIFLHPRCPCSRASLSELASILSRCGERVSAHAVFYRPTRDRDGWMPTDLETILADMPGLRVWHDRGGEEARRFGAATSGHLLLYDNRGELVFSGGITPGRGGQGENEGRAAVLGRILDMARVVRESPVFGCPLATPGPASDQECRR